jgi:ABC-type nitrate/sulfonate/bicarbonate transport system permease component
MNKTLDRDFRESIIYGAAGIFLFIFIWYLGSTYTNFGKVFPSPVDSLPAFFEALFVPIGKYTLLGHIGISLFRVAVGYTLSSIIGTTVGLLMGYSKIASAIIRPIFAIIRPIPGIAWIPIAIMWLGIGNPTIYFIIFVGGFSQMVMNTIAGAQQVPKELIGVAKVLGAKENQIFVKVILPAAVPYIFAGLQISLATSWMAVLAAEMITATEGAGWLILSGMQTGKAVNNVIGMISIGLVGLLLATLIREVERRLCSWAAHGS